MCKKKNDIFQSLPLLEKRHLVEEFNFRCYNTRSEMENGIGFTSGFKND
jgi:phenylacetate-coenzyme A ligase PaaK-like adenylate-forming protein